MPSTRPLRSSAGEAAREPIAIVGIGCRFPGGADDPGSFWRVIAGGEDVFSDVPADRWDLRTHYDPDPARTGKSFVRQGAFVHQPFDRFDAAFFGISPREASLVDPNQRLLLEVTWEAFEDAGIVPASLAGSATGVFVGGFLNDMNYLAGSPLNRPLLQAGTSAGISLTLLAARLSYVFDLRGPSVSLDTACSSSLVAFHQACQSVWSGESDMAVVGAATRMLLPETTSALCKGGFLSPDGRCKAFDSRANGYARGEGAGIVVLKRLGDALADGNPIYAVALGTACNHDGKTEARSVPRSATQIALIRTACAQAGVRPGQLQYVEAHGTGTAVGDPIEASSLGTALGDGRPEGERCVIGSVKTVLGHTEAAAGVAGLIKAALCLHRREIPPNRELIVPNPAIDFDGLRLRVATEHEPWPAHEGPALAGVNSFGFGGTNAHAVLAASPSPSAVAREDAAGPVVIPLSAHSESGLRALAAAWRDHVAPGGAGSTHALADLCVAAGAHRTHFAHRLAIVAGSIAELHDQLEAYLAGISRAGAAAGRTRGEAPRICFVYSGMGPQWWGMGRELLGAEPVFRDAVTRCSAALEPLTGWSLIDQLLADEDDSRMAETQVAQTANLAIQAGLTALWASWGVRPGCVLGHSVGEVAAAHASSALDFDDAIRVSFERSRAQARAAGRGAMLATGLSEAEVEPILRRWSGVSLAAVNGPSSTTLAGDPAALVEVAAELTGRGVFQRALRVDIAYHSHHMDALREDLLDALSALSPRSPVVPLLSTVTAAEVSGPELDASYWWRNVREPVRLAATVQRAVERGVDVFLEVGPHPVLGNSITECLEAAGRTAEVRSSLARGKPERRRLLESLAALYALGCEVDWTGVAPTGRFVRLPLYPWQRELHWAETAASRASRLGPQGHPLLGHRLATPEPTWEAELGPAFVPYAGDHLVEGIPVLPGAAYLEAALAGDRELGGAGLLEDIRIHAPLLLPRGADAPFFRLAIDGVSGRFAMHSRDHAEGAPWRLHATGRRVAGSTVGQPEPIDLDAVRGRCREGAPADAFYAMLAADRGLAYGPAFRGVRALWVGPDEALAAIEIPAALGEELDAHVIHPAVLDASFHAFFATLPEGREVYLPVGFDGVRYHGRPGRVLFCHCTRSIRRGDTPAGDVRICDERGRVLVEVLGLVTRRLDRADSARETDGLHCTPRWVHEEIDAIEEVEPAPATWLVLVDRRGVGDAVVEAARAGGIDVVVAERSDDFAALDPHRFRVRADHAGDLDQLVAAVCRAHPALECVVDLWRTEVAISSDLPSRTSCGAIERELFAQVCLVRSLRDAVWARPPRFWTVARGAEPAAAGTIDPAQSALSGLARVLRSEAMALRCSVLDIGAEEQADDAARALVREIASDGGEDVVAYRGGRRHVQRLEYAAPESFLPRREATAKTTAIRLEAYSTSSGPALHWRELAPAPLGPDDVVVRVNAAAIEARGEDADAAALPLVAADCCGVVEAVGADVPGLAPGDTVVALHGGAPASRIVVPAARVVPSPKSAARPGLAALLTAVAMLDELARLRPGQTVLVHGASTALGQSLVAAARASQAARVWVTATSQEGLDALAGRREQDPIDARASTWVDAALRAAGGRGVDVVVDLIGREPERCATLLAPRGRLIFAQATGPARPSARGIALRAGQAAFAFDPARFLPDRPELAGLLLETVERVARRTLQAPALREFAPERAADVAIHLAGPEPAGGAALYFAGLSVSTVPATGPLFRAEASYLVTGGLRGLGLDVARWMVEQGARTLVLVGRTGAASEEARRGVATLERMGARVVPAAVDVSDEAAVRDLIARIARDLPPLRGVVHSAVVLDDCNIDQLTLERMHTTFASKAQSAWNLHLATLDAPLDHFVLMSSATDYFGPVGQASYVAANAFLDGLAHLRHRLGLPALAANWGLIGDSGLAVRMRMEGAATEGIPRSYADNGLRGWKALRVAWLTAALGRMLGSRAPQLGFFDFDADTVDAVVPSFWALPRHRNLAPSHPRRTQGGERASSSLRGELAGGSRERRLDLAREIVHGLAAEVLGLERDRLDPSQQLANLGLDSLMAGQLKVLIERATGVTLPAVHIVGGPSVDRLAEVLVERLAAIAANTGAVPHGVGAALAAGG